MNIVSIPEEIKSEFVVEEDGKAFASQRATARLCGLKDHGTIRNLLKNLVGKKHLSDPLQPFSGQDFRGGEKLPDILVSAIVSHYALKGKLEATQALVAFSAIGIRTWIQQELNWQPLPFRTTESEDIRNLHSKFFRLQMRIESCIDYFPWEYGERITALEKRLEIQDEEIIRLKSEYSWFKKDYDRLKDENTNSIRQREYRKKLNSLVAKYEQSDEDDIRDFWSVTYNRLIFETGFDVSDAARAWKCSYLDAVETQGLMEQLYRIACRQVPTLNSKALLNKESTKDN